MKHGREHPRSPLVDVLVTFFTAFPLGALGAWALENDKPTVAVSVISPSGIDERVIRIPRDVPEGLKLHVVPDDDRTKYSNIKMYWSIVPQDNGGENQADRQQIGEDGSFIWSPPEPGEFTLRVEAVDNYPWFLRGVGHSTRVIVVDSPQQPRKPRETIEIPARQFARSENVYVAEGSLRDLYGAVIMNAPPFQERPNAAEWDVELEEEGAFIFAVQYATKESRPITIRINGQVWRSNVLHNADCYENKCQSWEKIGRLDLDAGRNVIRFESRSIFPHIYHLRLEPVTG